MGNGMMKRLTDEERVGSEFEGDGGGVIWEESKKDRQSGR